MEGWKVPEKFLPIPEGISRELHIETQRPPYQGNFTIPKNPDDIEFAVRRIESFYIPERLQKAKEIFKGKCSKTLLNGISCYDIVPQHAILPNKVILHVHGGGFLLNNGEGAEIEGMLLCEHSSIRVCSVDYQQLPKHPFPAGLDDLVTVYSALLRGFRPGDIGVFGTSAGGGLSASLILKLKELSLPLPVVVGLGTPWIDLTKTGVTYRTNENVDNLLSRYDGPVEEVAKLYAGTFGLKDPLVSPIYGDLSLFPPTILISGTRDLLLSCTVRMHRKLRNLNIEAALHVFEAGSHAFYIQVPEAEESKQAFGEISKFFRRHLVENDF